MTSSSPKSASLGPTPAARRYFQQFLGESAELAETDAQIITAVEPLEDAALADLGATLYAVIQSNGAVPPGSGAATILPDGLALSGFQTALYVALVNAVAIELAIETPATVRAEQGVRFEGGNLPKLAHDHLVLVARFSMDTIQAQKPPESFQGLIDLTVERLSSLVELASQAMMGADVDPFETFEHRDCENCGHLLQLHVGFESWEDVQAEHDRWCPKRRDA